jgi:hypothetical protein
MKEVTMLQTGQSPMFASPMVMMPRPLTTEGNQVFLALAQRVRRIFGATQR